METIRQNILADQNRDSFVIEEAILFGFRLRLGQFVNKIEKKAVLIVDHF